MSRRNTPPSDASARSRFDGRIGPVHPGEIRGWIAEQGAPDHRVEFALLLDGEEVGRFRADRLRSSLVGQDFGDGRHAFIIPVQESWVRPAPRRIQVRPLGGPVLPHEVIAPVLPLASPGIVPAPVPPSWPEPAPAAPGKETAVLRVQEPVPLSLTVRLARLQQEIHELGVALLDQRRKGEAGFAGPEQDALYALPGAVEAALLPLAVALFKAKDWPALASLSASLQPAGEARFSLRLMVARALLYERRPAEALGILEPFGNQRAADDSWQFYLGAAFARLDRYTEAAGALRRAVAARPEDGRYRQELVVTLRKQAARPEIPASLRTDLLEESVTEARELALRDPERAAVARRLAARGLYDLHRYDEAMPEVEQLIALAPRKAPAMFFRAQLLVAQNRIPEAVETAQAILAIEPEHQGARFQLRTLSSLLEENEPAGQAAAVLDTARHSPGTSLAGAIEGLDAGWISFTANDPAGVAPALEGIPGWCGRVLLADPAGRELEFWHAGLLRCFAEAGLIEGLADISANLQDLAPFVATLDRRVPQTWQPVPPGMKPRGTVICMSRHGIVPFGGGEQFLGSMAEHYRALGHEPLIVGTRPERVGETGMHEGRRYAFVAAEPAALRRLFLEERPVLVHVLSGLGYEVAQALDHLSIPFVYGVHYWRDCLGAMEGDTRFFVESDRGPIPRAAFRYVIERAATVYANSAFTRAVLEEAFHLRAPVLYSLPNDEVPPDDPELATQLTGGLKDFVLLLNAKPDKGFDLIVEVALRRPEVPFLAIASQSDAEGALRMVQQAEAGNITVIERTDRPDLLYRRALAVAVPSYRFVETFSRVCIEAQRFGRPVLGSDRGNVPYLLAQSGTVLPEDPEAWAAEIGRLRTDTAHRRQQEARAAENGTRYAYDRQRRGLHGILTTLGDRILVGVGSGVGNMLHVGPMLRNMARRLGRRVDVVVAEDHRDSLFLLHDPKTVNAVFGLRRQLLRRSYNLAFITNSFGDMRPPFAARQVIYSRDWRKFEPGGPLHETIHNLEAAKALLGIDYDPADAQDFYVGGLRYAPPADGRRIGFHGGSKEGFWTAKRWPHHPVLAARLQARGWECASFGIPEEYVEGTLNLTGGSLAEMAEAMRSCSYFITNDSGVMNIANALGIPLTALFGPTNPATRAPLRDSATWIATPADCAPCEVNPRGRATFHAGECRCIAQIPVEQVERHVVSELERLGLRPGGGPASCL
jgi:glycosyltransferase involved in cell wall biosynthesis/tetratricopeptide (TPR) repeat protein